MGKVTVYFKRLDPLACAPMKAHREDAGWDVTAVKCDFIGDVLNVVGSKYLYHTGIALALPKGCWADLRARSSIYKTGLVLANSVGTIDSSYRGEVMAVYYQMYPAPALYQMGDRIAQLVIQPVLATDVEFVEVDELPPSEDGRGEGGFGSTGH